MPARRRPPRWASWPTTATSSRGSTPTGCSTTAPAVRRSRSSTDGSPTLTWPELVLRRTRLDERDLLVLVGPEPDYRWRAFTADMVELAGRFGVVQWISLGAIPAAVPHTRPVPIIGTEAAARPAARRGHRRTGGHAARARRRSCRRSRSRSRRRACPALGYFAQVPHYVSGPYATAALELLRAVGTHLGAEIPAHELAEESRELRARLDTAAGLDETTRGYVERLESMYDEQRLPSGDDLISDIERFLRDQGAPGGGSPGRPAELGGSSTDRR